MDHKFTLSPIRETVNIKKSALSNARILKDVIRFKKF